MPVGPEVMAGLALGIRNRVVDLLTGQGRAAGS
jgi:hypothetical protein